MTIDCFWKWFLDSGGISGIVSGILSGLMVAGFLWALSWSRKSVLRREQVRRLRELVRSTKTEIRNKQEIVLNAEEGKKIDVPGDKYRLNLFKYKLGRFRHILLYDSPDLSTEERSSALQIADETSDSLKFFDSIPKGIPFNDQHFYNQHFFDKVGKLAWMKLSKK